MLINEKYEHLKVHNCVYNDRAQQILKNKHVCCLTQATGTGKSYHAFQLIHDMCVEQWCGSKAISILILVPGTNLENEWDRALSDNPEAFINKKGVSTASPSDFKFLNTLKKKGYLKEASQRSSNFKTIDSIVDISYSYSTMTYTKLAQVIGVKVPKDSDEDNENYYDGDDIVLSNANLSKLKSFIKTYDLVIMDEVHHISAPTYKPICKFIISEAQSYGYYVFGMTATSGYGDNDVKTYFDGNFVSGISMLQAQKGQYEIYNDANEIEEVDGESYRILPKFKIHQCFVMDDSITSSRETVNKYKAWIKSIPGTNSIKEVCKSQLEALIHAATPEVFGTFARSKLLPGKQKLICFYQQGEDRDSVKDFLSRAFKIDNVIYMHSSLKMSENDAALVKFKDEKNDVILMAIDKLSEGIHVDGVTGIIMLRPTTSTRIYLQQIGRMMSTDQKDKVLPLFDLVRNSDLQQFINNDRDPEISELIELLKENPIEDSAYTTLFKILDELRKSCEKYGAPESKIAMTGDIVPSLIKDFQNATRLIDFSHDITLRDLRIAFENYYADRGTFVRAIKDEDIHNCLIRTSADYILTTGIKGCYLYKILSARRNNNGKFKSAEELLDYTFNTLNITDSTMQKKYKDKFINPKNKDFIYMRKCLCEKNVKSLVNLLLD